MHVPGVKVQWTTTKNLNHTYQVASCGREEGGSEKEGRREGGEGGRREERSLEQNW